ncbi:MAG TPA: gluconate:H+ symporter [Vicinamibacterales bacterium]|nr:gluconate:H+ symporter [Vicinamibacterales bacterium]
MSTMPLVLLGAAIVALLILILRLKLNPFLALTLTSFTLGLCNGMTPQAALNSIIKGAGDTFGSIFLIIVAGAAIGKLIEESGAAVSVSRTFIRFFGVQRVQIAMVLTGFLVGLPMFYNAGFLVLTPLVYAVSIETGYSIIYLGLPLSAALSVTHGFVPPHPGPTTIANIFHADLNLTLLYGIVLAVPATLLGGPVLTRFLKHMKNEPPPALYRHREFKNEDLPSFGVSLTTILIPVLLMLFGAIVNLTADPNSALAKTSQFLSDANVALMIGFFVAIWTLGLRRGMGMDDVMKQLGAAASSVAMLLLLIASGGSFKQILLDGGVADVIKTMASQSSISPLLLAWGTAAFVRFAVGSATVAGITAAGIVLPLIPGSGVRPELFVIAVSTGSLMFSHFSDSGFWMFKEYYNATIKQTFQAWTAMECTVGTVGLIGVLILQMLLGAPK